jgi:opacity protein-like surface antigen
MTKIATVLLALLTAGQASAQEADWAYKATLYGWLPALSTTLDTDLGSFESSSSGSDVLSNLDMVFMGSLAAQRGRWGFVGDLLYVDLSNTEDTPFALYGDATVGVKTTAFSGYALYRVTSDPQLQFDVGAGFRSFDVEVDLALSKGLAAATSRSVDDSWTDPLLAARLYAPIADDWFVTGFADFGGTGSGDSTWQVYAGIGYAFDSRWSGQLGYRYMDISKDIDGRDLSIDLGGPLLAVTYSF